tara:strand:- start:3502 stop:4737 length:1236 start_codon:yes stop_codon:yes gene_type:complete
MANTITIGRLTFTSPATLSDNRSGSDHTLSINGTFVPNTVDEIKYLRDELLACANGYYTVPFTWEGDSSMSGYVKVNGAGVETSRVTVGGYEYSIDMLWLGNMGELEFESQFSGGIIENDHSITSSTTQFYAGPVDSYAHSHSNTPSNFERVGANGTTIVRYASDIRSYNAKYLVDPADFYKNACEVFTDGVDDVSRLRCGLESPNHSAASTILQNGLVKMTFDNTTTQSRFNIFCYDTDGYKSNETFAISRGVSETEWQGWRSVQILKNEPECATVRLTSYYDATNKDQRLTLDVTLKRGARHFSIVATQWSSAQFNIKPTSTVGYTDNTSYATETNNDSEGNRIVLGSPQNFDVDTTNGGINSTSSTATLKAFIGYEFGGTNATSIDTADKIRDQYLDNVYEVVRLVKT